MNPAELRCTTNISRPNMQKSKNEVRVESSGLEDAEIVLTAFGTTARIAKTAMAELHVVKSRNDSSTVAVLFRMTNTKRLIRLQEYINGRNDTGQMIDDVK